ncbi:hypothetical protein, variant [Aphanomyces invadans]|uniref:Uncharacterized protein n=1 Tax=Aphanomyces invadans TaxID=157072 RepID=A0A024UAR2_9STRA|nr:hypothetical protein, variant [Aphanomyces invadans]ETW03491.1 hypothetical protein, variant [Aphanomyces invadans]|eukprot:XP_008867720.1 hypothetical protein, variant [Aphanomyces invadans]
MDYFQMNSLHTADINPATGAPVLDADEHILAMFPSVRMFTNTYGPSDDDDASPSMESKGTGNLFVSSARVLWIFDQDATGVVGYAWDMTYLSLHAISRDVSTFPEACLYCQLDVEDEVNEIRFVPQDIDKHRTTSLQRMRFLDVPMPCQTNTMTTFFISSAHV